MTVLIFQCEISDFRFTNLNICVHLCRLLSSCVHLKMYATNLCEATCFRVYMWVLTRAPMWMEDRAGRNLFSLSTVWEQRISFRLPYLYTLKHFTSIRCLISFWRAILSQLGTSVFRTLQPMKFTVNMKCFRLFSYHHHLLSSESFRLLSLCPSLYLLLRECTQKSWVSSQHLGFFRRLQPASKFPFQQSQRVGTIIYEQKPLPEGTPLVEKHRELHQSSHSLFSLWGEESQLQHRTQAVLFFLLLLWDSSQTGALLQDPMGCELWGSSPNQCSIPSTLSVALHLTQLPFMLLLQATYWVTRLISIPTPSENNDSSQGWHLLCPCLGSVSTKEGASILSMCPYDTETKLSTQPTLCSQCSGKMVFT